MVRVTGLVIRRSWVQSPVGSDTFNVSADVYTCRLQCFQPCKISHVHASSWIGMYNHTSDVIDRKRQTGVVYCVVCVEVILLAQSQLAPHVQCWLCSLSLPRHMSAAHVTQNIAPSILSRPRVLHTDMGTSTLNIARTKTIASCLNTNTSSIRAHIRNL